MKYEIESGIPIPRQRELKNKRHSFPFDIMEVGQSIVVDFPEMVTARCAAVHCAKRKNKVFRTRLTESGLRIWRVA